MVKDDRQEFTARVLDLLGDDDLYRRKQEEARRHGQNWTIERLTEKLVTIYGDARAVRKGRASGGGAA